jgi:hypothetical protein
MRSTEQQAFTAPEGIALRYGMLYGGDACGHRRLARLDPSRRRGSGDRRGP